MFKRCVVCKVILTVTLSCTSGCAPPEPENEYKIDAGPLAGSPLPIRVQPAKGSVDVPRDPVIRVTYSEHLNSKTITQNHLHLSTGPISNIWILSYYDPIRRQLVAWPTSSLLKRVTWIFSLKEGVTGLDGTMVHPENVTYFKTSDQLSNEQPFVHRSFTTEVEPIFHGRCAQCHGGQNPAIAELNLDSTNNITQTAVNQKSHGWPGWLRIAPNRPGQSYLVYKISDYDKISGLRMPRNDNMTGKSVPLTQAEQEIIVDWIAGGASFFDPSDEQQ
jgi:hypothetical protein